MKKFLAIILATLMLVTFVACDNGEDKKEEIVLPFDSAVELLNMAWEKIPEDSKFMIGGGFNETVTMNEAGTIALTDKSDEALVFELFSIGLPEELVSKIDDAASIKNMMNANSFTAGAFRFATEADAKAAIDQIKASVFNRDWYCGFPEKLVVITLPGNYVVSIFGLGGLDADFPTDFITPFVDAVKGLVEGVEVVINENIPV